LEELKEKGFVVEKSEHILMVDNPTLNSLAMNSYGDYSTVRSTPEFTLRRLVEKWKIDCEYSRNWK